MLEQGSLIIYLNGLYQPFYGCFTNYCRNTNGFVFSDSVAIKRYAFKRMVYRLNQPFFHDQNGLDLDLRSDFYYATGFSKQGQATTLQHAKHSDQISETLEAGHASRVSPPNFGAIGSKNAHGR